MSDYVALRKELDAGHPVTGAYSADDEAAASNLNVVNISEPVAVVAGSELFNETDDGEYSALTQDEKMRWLSVCAIAVIDIAKGVAKSEARDIFGNQSVTWANLVALKSREVSRAYQIGWGPEVGEGVVRDTDVAYARSTKYDRSVEEGSKV